MASSGKQGDPAAAAADGVAAVVAKLRAYHARFETARDHRAVFAYVYTLITGEVERSLRDPQSGFEDPQWIADLDVAFAHRYFQAMDAIDRAPEAGGLDDVPRPWADVQRAIAGGKATVVENLLFSMTAHISYDLPLTLRDVQLERGGRTHLGDYHRMNAVLKDQIELVQTSLALRYNPLLRLLDCLAGRWDERFTDYVIRGGRAMAWYNATRLTHAHLEQDVMRTIQSSTGSFIAVVRNSGSPVLRPILKLTRWFIRLGQQWPPPAAPLTN